jgi:hypothetical protein
MKLKTRLIIAIIFYTLLGVIGILTYSTSGYMSYFGFELSLGWFLIILSVFILFTIVSFIDAANRNKEIAEDTANKKAQATISPSLEKPCKLSITRSNSKGGANMSVTVYLNGTEAGQLKNNQTLNLSTSLTENELTVNYDFGGKTNSIIFYAKSDGNIQVSFIYAGAKLFIM